MLSSVRSVPVYTSSLSTSVIPLIQENFEEMDEEVRGGKGWSEATAAYR